MPVPAARRCARRGVARSSARKLSMPCIVESPVASSFGSGVAAGPPPTATERRTRSAAHAQLDAPAPALRARKRRLATRPPARSHVRHRGPRAAARCRAAVDAADAPAVDDPDERARAGLHAARDAQLEAPRTRAGCGRCRSPPARLPSGSVVAGAKRRDGRAHATSWRRAARRPRRPGGARRAEPLQARPPTHSKYSTARPPPRRRPAG